MTDGNGRLDGRGPTRHSAARDDRLPGLTDPSLVPPEVGRLPPRGRATRPEELAVRLGVEVELVARLCANENPLGPSGAATSAASVALLGAHRYPDPDYPDLRRAIAAHHRLNEEQVVVGHGCSELIDLLVRTFVGPGQTVVSGWPSYPAYRLAAQVAGREFLAAPLRQGHLDLPGMAALVDARTKLVFVANPNNPTGTHVSRRALATFLHRLPPETIVAIDEAYADYVDAPDYPRAIEDFLPGRSRLVVLRTFSKVYGLAGLRVGYGLMAPELARHLERIRPVFALSAPAAAAATAALEDQAHVERSRRLVARERSCLFEGLERLRLDPLPSVANFVCARAAPAGFAAALEEEGVLVRDLEPYGVPGGIRVSVGHSEANRRFLAAAARVLAAVESRP